VVHSLKQIFRFYDIPGGEAFRSAFGVSHGLRSDMTTSGARTWNLSFENVWWNVFMPTISSADLGGDEGTPYENFGLDLENTRVLGDGELNFGLTDLD
jgi:hypothetical protein